MNTGKPRSPVSYPGMPFNQQMSFPRELTLRATKDGLCVFRYPVQEIELLYRKEHRWCNQLLPQGEKLLTDIEHDLLDIDLDIELRHAEQIRFELRGEEIVYDAKDRKIKAFGAVAPLSPEAGRIRLRILLDSTSIEVFGNEGRMDLSGVFFPDPDNHTICLMVMGGPTLIRELRAYELETAWPENPRGQGR